ncbi:typeIV pilus assembly protein pilP [Sorangium cellulosum]|uniref:TypeIV pilus assembly protein pilP n=1 Tax=Sorangium cellulosum TaxID=56 RepID=A0A2L0F354_SORCE|nr:pilus assembly protein PilP [Sorangium cellulosum]AUX46005.1 typeIV pilus assembly protein pilP [Sorangium cellulosum]
MSAGRTLLLAATWAAALAVAGCGEEEEPIAPSKPPAAAGAAVTASQRRAPAKTAASASAGAGAPEMPPLPLREFQEADFSESDRSRDPFRSFESLFATQARGRVTIQRQVLIDRYALDELKLVGVVSRAPARALLTDPTGLGWVVKVGDFVGKAEIVHSGGLTGVDVAVNWRVDRIRDADVVFIREDPSHPEIPPTTRVVALRPLGELNEPRLSNDP